MNGEVGNNEEESDVDDVESNAGSEDTVVLSEDVIDIDDDSDVSAEINIEQLVAKIESGDENDAQHRKEVHRRLEELAEQRRIEKELENTFDFSLDDDL
jgi:hypothetical protein